MNAMQNRVQGLRQVHETAFGQGRGFRKFSRGLRDWPRLGAHLAAEFVVDGLAFFRAPSWDAVRQPVARLSGLISGWRSLARTPATAPSASVPTPLVRVCP